jgi:hypothetical protein
MPLYWTADSKQRLFTGLAEDEVGFEDVVAFMEALAGLKAFSFRKLFDICGGRSCMTDDELLAVIAMIRDCHCQEDVGPLAMVATDEQTVRLARLLGALAIADRPFRVFERPKDARHWLDGACGRRRRRRPVVG